MNLERLLVRMSVGDDVADDEFWPTQDKASGVVFFELPGGTIARIDGMGNLLDIPGYQFHELSKKVGDAIGPIRSSLDRYGHAVFGAGSRAQVERAMDTARNVVREAVVLR